MLRWAKRNGGWPLNGGLWMGKCRKGEDEGQAAIYLGKEQAPRKEKAQAMAATNSKTSDALLTRPHLPVHPSRRLDGSTSRDPL